MRHMTAGKLLLLSFCGLMLSGCNTWSTSNVELKTKTSDVETASVSESSDTKTETPQAQAGKALADIIITEKDITDRKYQTIGDIDVTVNKTTIFHADPTREIVDEKLREEAAKLQADAVILVRYGTVGIGLFSWGSLDGKGRAIKFVN